MPSPETPNPVKCLFLVLALSVQLRKSWYDKIGELHVNSV